MFIETPAASFIALDRSVVPSAFFKEKRRCFDGNQHTGACLLLKKQQPLRMNNSTDSKAKWFRRSSFSRGDLIRQAKVEKRCIGEHHTTMKHNGPGTGQCDRE